ncbi:unnamed protein product [Paramecium octaurelia]|uniref:Uncharacterized protein n=1 Tax=Paramecium octaurelia TaxID=43137 RepID=A0A8S1W9U6_PAROT|nr:unnamed protein product [Paramecium octaurelia]
MSAQYLNSQQAQEVNLDSIKSNKQSSSLFPFGVSRIAPNSVMNLPTPNFLATPSLVAKKNESMQLHT